MEVKSIFYAGGCRADYVIDGNNIYYCGADDIRKIGSSYSVVNAWNLIITLITEALPQDRPRYPEPTFFAVLTAKNWICQPNGYQCRMIIRTNNGIRNNVDFKNATLPSKIVEAFRPLIGETPQLEKSTGIDLLSNLNSLLDLA